LEPLKAIEEELNSFFKLPDEQPKQWEQCPEESNGCCLPFLVNGEPKRLDNDKGKEK
jgi:hypothetical protein